MQGLNGQSINRFFANGGKNMSDVTDIFNVNRFTKSDSYYFSEIESQSSIAPAPTNYPGKTYTFVFGQGELYDNARLVLNWGEFIDASGTDGLRNTVPIEYVSFYIGSELIASFTYESYIVMYKILSNKQKDLMGNLGNFTDTVQGDQPPRTQIIPLVTPAGGLLSRDIRSTSTTIPVPYGLGNMSIRVTLRDQWIVGGASVAPELEGIAAYCDIRKYRNPSFKATALQQAVGSIPFFTHNVVKIPPVSFTTDNVPTKTYGEIENITVPMASLADKNTQFIVARLLDAGDTERMSSVVFVWSDKKAGIYEHGALAKLLSSDTGVRIQMFNSGNGVTTGGRWEDGEIVIGASVSPISEFETWNPDFYTSTSNPQLQFGRVSGLQKNHQYTMEVFAITVEAYSMRAGKSSEN